MTLRILRLNHVFKYELNISLNMRLIFSKSAFILDKAFFVKTKKCYSLILSQK